MNGDLISRQAVENAIAETIVNGESLGYSVAYDILSDLPSVTDGDLISRQDVLDIISDVMPIYGDNYHYILEQRVKNLLSIGNTAEWTKDDECSNCGKYVYVGDRDNYCPHCGCKMKEVE